MDFHFALGFALPFALGLAALGSAIGLGRAVGSGLEAMARQPEIANKILMNMIIGCAFIESITIYVLVYAFIFGGKI